MSVPLMVSQLWFYADQSRLGDQRNRRGSDRGQTTTDLAFPTMALGLALRRAVIGFAEAEEFGHATLCLFRTVHVAHHRIDSGKRDNRHLGLLSYRLDQSAIDEPDTS